MRDGGTRRALRWAVGVAALVAPALHSLSDAMEWHRGAFFHAAAVDQLRGGPVAGGLLFAAAMLRARWLPRSALLLFAASLVVNAVVASLPLPDILQTLGSAVRNAGLMAMGHAVLLGHARPSGAAPTA